jgi:hypothetical protein
MINVIRNCLGSALSYVDHAAVRLNRFSPCVRKTVYVSVNILNCVAVVFLNRAIVNYTDNFVGKVLVTVICYPYIFASVYTVWKRYGWLHRITPIYCPPESVLNLLRVDTSNFELPIEYRNETTEFVRHLEWRREEELRVDTTIRNLITSVREGN